MKTFLARQPILDQNGETIGYELLFRKNNNQTKVEDDYAATAKVIKDLIVNFGIKEISDDKRVFVKFNRELILDGGLEFMRPDKLVVEISEMDMEDAVLVEKIKRYKADGYLFVGQKMNALAFDERYLVLVDMLKIDFKSLGVDLVRELVEQLRVSGKVLIAENVEEQKSYEIAKEMGFDMFQGHYFQKPTIMEASEAASIPSIYFQLLEALNQDVVDYGALASIIEQDSFLTLSILKLMNTAAYYSNSKVTSVRKALVRMGVKESRQILMINMLKSLTVSAAGCELVSISLRRGKQAEKLAAYYDLQKRKDELFLVGLLSLINIIVKRPMPQLLVDIPLQSDVIAALIGERNALSDVMETVILYEMEAYEEVEKRLFERGCSVEKFNHIFAEAFVWSDKVNE